MDVQARWLRWMTGMLVGTAVLAIMLIFAGIFDPKPVGDLVWERPLLPQTIAANEQQIIWLEQTPQSEYSLRLSAAHRNGETDIAYGLALGSDDDFLTVTVSPLGYVAVEEVHSAFRTPHSPFRPWPHVRPDENEIWLDIVDGRITVRINREWLWEGEVEAVGQIGLVVESWGETAVVDFQTLQLFAAQKQ